MPRPPRPDDLYRLRIADRAAPVARTGAGWSSRSRPWPRPTTAIATALWLVATDEDGPPPRQLTIGTRHDRHPRFSPDGSDPRVPLGPADDRRGGAEARDAKDREDATQVHLLPLDGGEARRLTDLPARRDRLRMVARRHPARRDLAVARGDLGRGPPPPRPDRGRAGDAAAVRLPVHRPAPVDAQRRRLHLRPDRPPVARRRRDRGREPPDRRAGRRHRAVAGRPTARRIAFTSDRGRDPDLVLRSHIHVVDVATKPVTAISAGPRSIFGVPTWTPDGRIAARHGRPPPGGTAHSQRPVGLRGGRVGRHARRRPQRLAPPRPDARSRG